jgi:effector-binding domain-containing protein
MLDEVYAVVRAGGAEQDGHNVMVFRDLPDGGLDVEVGVQVAAPFESTGSVTPSELPAGIVAVAVHHGPYGQLGVTHDAIHTSCSREGLTLAGPRWEIYGDWTEDESALETEVVYLLG